MFDESHILRFINGKKIYIFLVKTYRICPRSPRPGPECWLPLSAAGGRSRSSWLAGDVGWCGFEQPFVIRELVSEEEE